MDSMLEITNSTGFLRVMQGLSVTCLFLAIGMGLISIAYYGRARETENVPAADEKWVMLFATWRDSLIITLLYAGQGFAYRFAEFGSFNLMQPQNILFYAPVVQPVLSLLADILIFTIAALRIIALTRWLNARRSA